MIASSENNAPGATRLETSTTSGGRSISIAGNRLDSRQLFVADREIIIAHGDETYRLRLTSQNKLILTK